MHAHLPQALSRSVVRDQEKPQVPLVPAKLEPNQDADHQQKRVISFIIPNPSSNQLIYLCIQKQDQGIMSSPTHKFSERWKDFEKNMEREKVLRKTTIDRQLAELSAKLAQHTSSNQQVYGQLRDRVNELKEQVSRIDETKKEVDRNLQEQILKVEESFNLEVENEKNKSREEIEKWTKNADEKLLNVCHSMQEITNEKGQTIEAMAERMTRKLGNLKENIIQQRKKRQQSSNELNEAIQKELYKLHGELEINRKVRENTNKKITKMVQDIEGKILSQIEQEKKARKQTNKALLTLLEETCAKIEKAFF